MGDNLGRQHVRGAVIRRVPTTTESTKAAAHDTLQFEVYNTAIALIGTLATYSNLNATKGNVLKALDMTPYIGQRMQVRFQGANDATLETTWELDNVRLVVGTDCGGTLCLKFLHTSIAALAPLRISEMTYYVYKDQRSR